MSEPILKALVQLFALISNVQEGTGITGRSRDIVRMFLAHHLNNEMVEKYMEVFGNYVQLYHPDSLPRGSLQDRKRTSLTAIRILGICETINEELQQKQKIYVFIQLLDFILFSSEISENELDFIETVAAAFNIPVTESRDIMSFILASVDEIVDKSRLMIIDGENDSRNEGVKHLIRENMKGSIAILFIGSTNTYILRYRGHDDLFLNGQNIFEGQTYVLDHGSTIRNPVAGTIYYNDVTRIFTEEAFRERISINASGISLKFRNSDNGIHNVQFHEESGTLVGILGGSGVGKTTLLNVLSGMQAPDSGEVMINGYNLYSPEGKQHLRGVIGFVPQDDLLIEELTVFQNLWFNARMCLDNLPPEKITEAVDTVLREMDLYDIRNLKVGNPLNKVISGGQRKRLNIALELIREPTVLFADEPTSGLSSVDSEVVMSLLKEQTYRGKLVVINIHQPGSDIYKMFDKVMFIDRGGYQIFYGNPTEAVIYFRSMAGYSNASEDQCIACGNVNADQMLQIVEAKVINELGRPTHVRKVSPAEWAEKFKVYSGRNAAVTNQADNRIPVNYFSVPGLLKQTRIFFLRDIMSKLANRQYVIISLLGAPLLALLLAWFTKYMVKGSYRFMDNENLPAYLFMCVITSLFMGLIISAEEIVRDRKILRRESFLDLSRFSYLNSKVAIMFIISAIQTLSFILIGNYILEIRGMTMTYWAILFTTSCLANLLGLNISSAFDSVITIYILIPFIIIPQLLFSGVLVKYDRLRSHSETPGEFVPLIGEMMPARWSFEALAVEQFRANGYEKNFFRNNIEIYRNDWYAHFLVNLLRNDLQAVEKYRNNDDFREIVEGDLIKLGRYINELNELAGFGPAPADWRNSLQRERFDTVAARRTRQYLDILGKHFRDLYRKHMDINDSIVYSIGEKNLVALRENYENSKLKEYLLDLFTKDKAPETNDRIIRKYAPVYMMPVTRNGRAHFYAPYKQVGSLSVGTFRFNMAVLWIAIILLYIALYYNVLSRMLSFLGNLRSYWRPGSYGSLVRNPG